MLFRSGVEAGDLVFMSPYTFAATGEVVHYLGAIPVFVDIDPVTLNIDVGLLREAIRSRMDGAQGRPRAIIPVHLAGISCPMDEIWALARETGLAVVEDAAHAFPAADHGRPVGTIPADVTGSACFSFYATKTLTTGEGGMFVTEDEQLADRVRSMSLHGLSRQAWSRYSAGGSWSYDIVAPGYKYNLTDIAAAMGRVQLGRAEQMRSRRAEIAARYSAAFATSPALEVPADPADVEHSWHLYVLRANLGEGNPTRDDIIATLTAQSIGTSVHFIPLHLHSYYVGRYGYTPDDFPVATAQFRRALSLPIHSSMTDADVDRVIAAVLSCVPSDLVVGR